LKKYLLIVSLIFSSLSLYANDAAQAESLFEKKCSTCHVYYRPDDINTLVAPPIKGVVRHLRSDFKSQQEIISHVQEFVLNPTHEKAICPSVQRFGLMPSQNGVVTKEELAVIAKWMLEKF